MPKQLAKPNKAIKPVHAPLPPEPKKVIVKKAEPKKAVFEPKDMSDLKDDYEKNKRKGR